MSAKLYVFNDVEHIFDSEFDDSGTVVRSSHGVGLPRRCLPVCEYRAWKRCTETTGEKLHEANAVISECKKNRAIQTSIFDRSRHPGVCKAKALDTVPNGSHPWSNAVRVVIPRKRPKKK